MVVLDVTEAHEDRPRGWSRYVRHLAEALGGLVTPLAGRAWAEVVWEQVGLPRALRRRGADLVHSPNCFLPLRRPCPGVVTIHDLAFEAFPEDFAPRTRAKFRWITPRAARSAERVVCVSAFTRDDVCERYGVDPEQIGRAHV